MKINENIITIDGPSYVGKTTIAKELSRLFNCIHVNTGHMYRAVSKLSIDNGISNDNEASIISLAKNLNIEFKYYTNSTRTFVNNVDETESLHTPAIDAFSSKIAISSKLREVLNTIMRSYIKKGNVIFEGRDLGTVVFPEALWKFYITASLDIRARRMKKKLIEIDPNQDLIVSDLMPMVAELDEREINRKVGPLRKASDAIIYDNSDSPSEVQDALILQYYINHSNELVNNASQLINYKT